VTLTTSVAGILRASNTARFATWPVGTAVSTASTTDVVRFGDNYLYVFKGARSAPGPAGRHSRRSAARRAALTQARRSSRCHGRGVLGGCAPGRRLPLLGPPGHGGVGARVIPKARPASRSAVTINATRATCKAGPSSRRSSVKPGKITRKSASRHT
jgi:hypothetical protein